MARPTLSPQTREALQILAASIRAARLRRGWTEAELADRVGVSRPTIVNLEAGQPGVAVGTVLEAATLVGVPLFSHDAERRAAYGALKSTELALLPEAARSRRAVDDDF
jgi:transcriptional regulator with XRE-family HTH domain